MLKSFADRILTTAFVIAAILTLHTLFGAATLSAACPQGENINEPNHHITAQLAENNDCADDFNVISDECSLPHTAFARSSSVRTIGSPSIAKQVQMYRNVISQIINRLYSSVDDKHFCYSNNFSHSCEYYIFALRRILI